MGCIKRGDCMVRGLIPPCPDGDPECMAKPLCTGALGCGIDVQIRAEELANTNFTVTTPQEI